MNFYSFISCILIIILIMCFVTVSQFTLSGFMKGNKPDFHLAMAAHLAKPFYASLVDRFRNAYTSDSIKGMFQFQLPFLLIIIDGDIVF